MADEANDEVKQVEIAKRLQEKLLNNFEKLLDANELTPTDRATLTRLLMQNGWTLDESRIPKGLRDKLTSHLDPKADFEDNDNEV